jgi:hypothetical protein
MRENRMGWGRVRNTMQGMEVVVNKTIGSFAQYSN